MTIDIDGTINEAFEAEAPEVNSPDVEAVTEEEVVADEVADEGNEDAQSTAEPKDEPFPKKAINALSRRDKQIGKLKAEREALAKELEAFKAKFEESKGGQPKEEQFDSYSDYLEARQKWLVENEFGQRDLKQKEERINNLQTQEQAEWYAEREETIGQLALETSKTIPDFMEVMLPVQHVFDAFPPELEHMFLSLDNAPLAAYNLAKEGKLERLATLPLNLAAVELYQAQAKAYEAPKKVSKAPKPISASKGSGTLSKNVTQMDAEQLKEWVNS